MTYHLNHAIDPFIGVRYHYFIYKTQIMIDHLSVFSKKIARLKPLFILTTSIALFVLGYVVFFENSADKEILIIPCIVGVLWSLVCLVFISAFPFVPSKTDTKQPFYHRLKIMLTRGFYYIVSLLFIVLTTIALFLTIKLFNVWWIDF